MNISIAGVGYLGLTTASVLASAGYKVYAIDINPEIIEKLGRGESHFFEPGLGQLVKNAVNSGNLIPTLDYEQAITDSQITFICVDTIGLEDGSLSTRSVEASASSIAKYMGDDHIIVVKSTVPSGTHKKIKNLISSISSKNYHYVSKPEFLAEGSAVLDTLLPERLVIGTSSDYAFTTLTEIFGKVDRFALSINLDEYTKYANIYSSKLKKTKEFKERVLRVSVESAELIKVTSNSFLALKISFANSIARLSDKVGADINEIMDGVGADPRIGRDFLYAGLGWGGGCFPKDIKGLIKSGEDLGCDMEILKEAYQLNSDQTIWTISKARQILGDNFSNSKISVLGLAFKPGTDDLRLSPATKLIEELSECVGQIRVFDPQAEEKAREFFVGKENIYYSGSMEESVEGSDLVILATDWPEFLDCNLTELIEKMRNPNFLDARNRWSRDLIEKKGGKYFGLGR